MSNFNLPDIDPVALESTSFDSKTESEKKPKNSTFDEKNYLDTRLKDGEEEKKVVIRLLPIDFENGGFPFVKVHRHSIQVKNPNTGHKEWKNYICLKNTDGIDNEKYGNKCPLCEFNYAAYKKYKEETDPIKKEFWLKESLSKKAFESVIVRCIERGKEDEGVKFWIFNRRAKGGDPYDVIMKLYREYKEQAAADGENENILSINEGRDLIITFHGGTTAPTIAVARKQSPLSADPEQANKWIYDAKRWQDVFPVKAYEYLSLIAEERTPWYDKDKKKWVDRDEYNAEHGISYDKKDNAADNAEKALLEGREPSEDVMSQVTVPDFGTNDEIPEMPPVREEDIEDDLPF